MTDAPDTGLDYSRTLYLPKTDFPMRAGLPQKEPEILARWARENLYGALRDSGRGRPKFVLHDGPPYANGNVHIGTALNKILKDLVVRSHQMAGKESNYVPGWDCHGLPIEWKVEEEFYQRKGKAKPDFADARAMIAFRQECRAYAEHWLSVQREEFKRLGVIGDWDHPYSTMSYPAEAQIAREIHKFAANGLLYRGSKPVMWSVVEKTALAEAEVEYEDYTSDTVYVAFPVVPSKTGVSAGIHRAAGEVPSSSEISTLLERSRVVIWTTTPWTIPGNRAVAYSRRIEYGIFEVLSAPAGNWARPGDLFVLAKRLAPDVMASAKVEDYELRADLRPEDLWGLTCAHPLRELGYDFDVPLLDGDHVTEDAGTGFVHTAPGHGREDFDLWTSAETQQRLRARGIDARIPYAVDENGAFTERRPGLRGQARHQRQGREGRRQRGGHQGPDQCRRPSRARQAQAPIPA